MFESAKLGVIFAALSFALMLAQSYMSMAEEERPPSETDVIPALVIGPCYVFTEICADGYEKDWILTCTGHVGFQWASPMGKVGEVCDG